METGSISSIPSSSVSNSSARSTPTPNPYKPITQSASLLALTKIHDDDLKRRGPDDLLRLVRRLEGENNNLVAEHSNMVKDMNKKMQILLLEIRGLKDVNQSLQDDNQELRDLCCFLDDDRQRGRKLAREWQRFGRYTASVMRSEVSAYQEKLKELEAKQQELISDNLDLKELCLYLDQERMRANQPRDEGDGSSSSTIAGNEDTQGQNDIELVPVSQLNNNSGTLDNDPATNEYIRQLEEKVRSLEKEKKISKASRNTAEFPAKETPYVQVTGTQRVGPDGTQSQDTSGNKGTSPNKPEAVVHAMKVLEVHENLERPQTAVGEDNTLDDKEKAIVREMCNVVWRKLGSVKAEQQESLLQSQPPVYENFQPQLTRSKSTPPESTGTRNQSTAPGQVEIDNRYYTSQEPNYTSNTEPMGQFRPNTEPVVLSTGQPVAYVQRTDNSKGHTVFQVTPTYPVQDPRRFDDQGRLQSQRPPPGQETQPYDQSSNMQYPSQQQGRYGYVHTSRSTPVTPVPQQQSQLPHSRMDPRSQSPGPVRRAVTPRASDMPRSHSPGPGQHQQYPRSESQSNPPVYQNQSPLGNMGNNSYENVPSSYYNSQPPLNTAQLSHNRSQDSGSSGYDSNSYPIHSASGGKAQKSQPVYHPPPPHNHRQPPSVSKSPPYYQNVPERNPNSVRTNVRDHLPQDSHHAYQGAPPTPVPHRHTSSGQSYSRVHPAYPTSAQSQPVYTSAAPSYQAPPPGIINQPPGYNAPPHYQNRRTSYIEARENDEPLYDGRTNIGHHYRQ